VGETRPGKKGGRYGKTLVGVGASADSILALRTDFQEIKMSSPLRLSDDKGNAI